MYMPLPSQHSILAADRAGATRPRWRIAGPLAAALVLLSAVGRPATVHAQRNDSREVTRLLGEVRTQLALYETTRADTTPAVTLF